MTFYLPAKSLRTRPRKSGFTLIEILIVLTIIGILASLLFPVFGKVRENARRTSCQSNMQQLGMAFLQYAQDYSDRLPGATDGPSGATVNGGWIYYSQFGKPVKWDGILPGDKASFDVTKGSLYPYVKSAAIYICPSDSYGPQTGLSYAVNACVSKQVRNASGVRTDLTASPPVAHTGKKISLIKNPSQFMLLTEEVQPGSADGTAYLDNSSTDDGYFNSTIVGKDPAAYTNYLALRHNEGGNVAFLDGHVKWYKRDQIVTDKFQIGGEGDLAKGCPEFQSMVWSASP